MPDPLAVAPITGTHTGSVSMSDIEAAFRKPFILQTELHDWVTYGQPFKHPQYLPPPAGRARPFAGFPTEAIKKFKEKNPVGDTYAAASKHSGSQQDFWQTYVAPFRNREENQIHFTGSLVQTHVMVAPLPLIDYLLEYDFPLHPDAAKAYRKIKREREQKVSRGKWPWGEYENRYLRVIAAAMQEHYADFNPATDIEPSQSVMAEWIRSTFDKTHPDFMPRGISLSKAEEIASILSPDGTKAGAKKKV